MERKYAFLAIALALILTSIVLVSSEKNTEDFVKKIAKKKGISESEILGVEEVDIEDLPKGVDIRDIDTSNIGIFRINTTGDKPTFVISLSGKNINKISKTFYSTTTLDFGFSGETNKSVFLKTSAGISSENRGYVMLRKGSVTGISTIAGVTGEGNDAEVVLFKNRKETYFGNFLDSSAKGIKKAYAAQSANALRFNPGDVLSVKVRTNNAKIQDISTLVELTFDN